jgi:hypothetical protein
MSDSRNSAEFGPVQGEKICTSVTYLQEKVGVEETKMKTRADEQNQADGEGAESNTNQCCVFRQETLKRKPFVTTFKEMGHPNFIHNVISTCEHPPRGWAAVLTAGVVSASW